MSDIKALEFEAEIRQVKSMVDGTVNLTINIPEYCKEQSADILKHIGKMARVFLEYIDDKPDNLFNGTPN